MAFSIKTDPQTGRTVMQDELGNTVLVGAEDGGTLLLQALQDNVDDALRHQNTIIFKGVPDWNGSTGTDNGTAFDAVITQALAASVPTTIIIPPGRYYLGTSRFSYAATNEITLQGVGDVELVGNHTTAVLSFDGELASLGRMDPVPTLDGDHLRTLTTGIDGKPYYRGVLNIDSAVPHEASVGDPCHIYGSEAYASTWGYLTCHTSHVVAVPSTTRVTIAHETFFEFYDGDVLWFPRYGGPIHLKNIKWKNIWSSDLTQILTLYRCPNSTIEDCEFDLISNPGGQSDCVSVSDFENLHISRSKFENCRYAVNANRMRNVTAKDCEINFCRHFVSWGTASYGLWVSDCYGTGNDSLVDGHNGFEAHFRNIQDLNSFDASEGVFNCRNFGYSLENVVWEGTTADTPVYYMSGQSLIAKYQDLWHRAQCHIKNLTLRNSSATVLTIGDAGRVSIDGLTLDGKTQVDIGNGTYGVAQQTVANVTGATSIRYYEALQTQDEQPRYWQDAEYTEYTGTATAGGASTITLEDHSLGDDEINGYLCDITAGTGSGQSERVTDFDENTLVATVANAWGTPPDATSQYRISRYEITALDFMKWSQAFRWNKVYSHLWGGSSTNGDTDTRMRRLRLNMAAGQSFASPNAGINRWEALQLRFDIIFQFGSQFNRNWFEYEVRHKVVPTPSAVIVKGNEGGRDHPTLSYTMDISDVTVASDFSGWVEFSIKPHDDFPGIAVWLEATSQGLST